MTRRARLPQPQGCGGRPRALLVAENDGGGVVASLTRVADAAAAGDAGPVRDQVAANCTSAWFEGVR